MTTSISSLAGQARRPRIGVDFHTFDGLFQGSRSHLLGVYREAIRRAPEYDFVFFCANPEALRAADPAFAMPNAYVVAMPHKGGLARLTHSTTQFGGHSLGKGVAVGVIAPTISSSTRSV